MVGTGYTNVILGLAYAALITVWTQADQVLDQWWWAAAGLLAFVSIFKRHASSAQVLSKRVLLTCAES